MWVQRTETGIHRINIQAIMGPDDRNTDKFTNLTQIARARIEYGGYIPPKKNKGTNKYPPIENPYPIL